MSRRTYTHDTCRYCDKQVSTNGMAWASHRRSAGHVTAMIAAAAAEPDGSPRQQSLNRQIAAIKLEIQSVKERRKRE